MTTKQKTLSERLAEFKGHKPNGILLSMLDEIEQSLSEGWTKKDIHELLVSEGKVNTGYSNFSRLLGKLLAGRSKKNVKPLEVAALPSAPTAAKKVLRGTEVASGDSKPKTFNPVPRDPSELF